MPAESGYSGKYRVGTGWKLEMENENEMERRLAGIWAADIYNTMMNKVWDGRG